MLKSCTLAELFFPTVTAPTIHCTYVNNVNTLADHLVIENGNYDQWQTNYTAMIN